MAKYLSIQICWILINSGYLKKCKNFVYLIHVFIPKLESMTVIKGIGVMIDNTYLSGNSTSKFIELSKIKDVIIFERVTPYTVYI